jgi:DNA-binding protein HU-beta
MADAIFVGVDDFRSKSRDSAVFACHTGFFAGLSRVKSRGFDSPPGSDQGKGCLMNKNDLIASVADKTGMSKAGAGQAVDATFDAITDALKMGDDVKIIGFGNFAVAKRAASMGRNPRTGEAIKIAASKSPKFKAGKGLKDAVNR